MHTGAAVSVKTHFVSSSFNIVQIRLKNESKGGGGIKNKKQTPPCFEKVLRQSRERFLPLSRVGVEWSDKEET